KAAALIAIIRPRPIEVIAPRVEAPLRSTGGLLPLSLRRQTLAGPGTVGFGLTPDHTDHWLLGLIEFTGLTEARRQATGRLHKFRIERIGHFVFIDVEGVEIYLMPGGLICQAVY